MPPPHTLQEIAPASHKRKRGTAPQLLRTYATAADSRPSSHSNQITTGRGHHLPPAHSHSHGHSALAPIRPPGRLRASRSVPAHLRLAPDAPIKPSQSTADRAVTPDTPRSARNPHPDKRARSSEELPPLTFSDSSTDDDLDFSMQADVDPTPTVERTMLEDQTEAKVAARHKPQMLDSFSYKDWLALRASYGHATRLYEDGQRVEAFQFFLSIITECSRCWLTVPDPSILFTTGPRRSSATSHFASSARTPAPTRPSTPPSILLQDPSHRIRHPESLKPSRASTVTHYLPPTPPTTPSIDLGRETASSLHTLFACSLSIYGTLSESSPDPPLSGLDASTCWHAALDLFTAGDAAMACSQHKGGDGNIDWRVALIQGRTFAQLALSRKSLHLPPSPLLTVIRAMYPNSARQIPSGPLPTSSSIPNLISNAVDHLLAALLLAPPTTPNRHHITWIVASDILALAELGTSTDQQDVSRETADNDRIWRAKRADALFARVEKSLSSPNSSHTTARLDADRQEPRTVGFGNRRIAKLTLADVQAARQRCRLLAEGPPQAVPEFSPRAPRRSSTTSVVRVAMKEMVLHKHSLEPGVRDGAEDIHMC